MKPIWASEGFNVVAKWVESRFKMAPWRLLGEPWAALGQPSGGPGALRQILDRFWVSLGTPFGSYKMLKNCLESHLKFGLNSELSFGSSGDSLGHFWGQFWRYFWVLFEVPSRESGFLKNLEKPFEKQ